MLGVRQREVRPDARVLQGRDLLHRPELESPPLARRAPPPEAPPPEEVQRWLALPAHPQVVIRAWRMIRAARRPPRHASGRPARRPAPGRTHEDGVRLVRLTPPPRAPVARGQGAAPVQAAPVGNVPPGRLQHQAPPAGAARDGGRRGAGAGAGARRRRGWRGLLRRAGRRARHWRRRPRGRALRCGPRRPAPAGGRRSPRRRSPAPAWRRRTVPCPTPSRRRSTAPPRARRSAGTPPRPGAAGPAQGGVVGQRLVQGVAQVPAVGQVQAGRLDELALAPQPLEEQHELELEIDHGVEARSPDPGVAVADQSRTKDRSSAASRWR